MNFLNLPEEYCKDESYFCVYGILFEGNVTYGQGSKKGPHEIIKASKQLEYYDEQFDSEAFQKGIVYKEIKSFKDDKDMISKVIKNFPKNEFIVSLGGDHSVTLGCVGALENDELFDVIIFDAHSDLRDSWNDSIYNHACVSKRLSKKHNLLICGVRSQDIDEVREKPKNVEIIKSYDMDMEIFKEKLSTLSDKIYISIDVDVFDPSFIRNTGTPEPGGFFWENLIDYLKIIFKTKNVLSCDVVEFAPNENYRAESYSLAKLCYKLINLKDKFN